MLISNAVYADGELRLKTSSADARRFAFHFNEGNYEIVKEKKRRSLDANAYYWRLLGDLAAAVEIPAMDIYKDHVKDVGSYAVTIMPTEAVENYEKLWTSNHYGRFIETRACRFSGFTTVLSYYGSSDYDVKQMSRLIDICVQDCKNSDVETKPREYIDSLLEAWNGR